jgi:hypothetical protein
MMNNSECPINNIFVAAFFSHTFFFIFHVLIAYAIQTSHRKKKSRASPVIYLSEGMISVPIGSRIWWWWLFSFIIHSSSMHPPKGVKWERKKYVAYLDFFFFGRYKHSIPIIEKKNGEKCFMTFDIMFYSHDGGSKSTGHRKMVHSCLLCSILHAPYFCVANRGLSWQAN